MSKAQLPIVTSILKDVSKPKKIFFSKAVLPETAIEYADIALKSGNTAGDEGYTKLCRGWFEKTFHTGACLLTTSGTHALEMCAILSDIKPGDEVILPSFTFSSTANAFALRGAKLCFVDIRPGTMNIDEREVLKAINSRTKAIVVVHYGGVACKMEPLLEVCAERGIKLIEDAAHCMHAQYNGQELGTIGDFGALSFHETKNITTGEGGAILIRDSKNLLSAEILREKGTNRSQFFRGEVDKYTWRELGSSYLLSDVLAGLLYAQLEIISEITARRMAQWQLYYSLLLPLMLAGKVELPLIPEGCSHNAHLFFIKCKDLKERAELIRYMKSFNIDCVFHYVPLHSAPAGQKYGYFFGKDVHTTVESERLLRLPLNLSLTLNDIHKVGKLIGEFYGLELERSVMQSDTQQKQ